MVSTPLRRDPCRCAGGYRCNPDAFSDQIADLRGTDAGFIRSATPPGSTCCHTPEHLPPLNQQPKRTTKQTRRRSLRKKPRPCRGPGQPTPDGGIKARSSQGRPGRSFPASTAPRPTTTSRPVMPYRLDSAGQAKSTDGITLSEREGRGERAQCRRSGVDLGVPGCHYRNAEKVVLACPRPSGPVGRWAGPGLVPLRVGGAWLGLAWEGVTVTPTELTRPVPVGCSDGRFHPDQVSPPAVGRSDHGPVRRWPMATSRFERSAWKGMSHGHKRPDLRLRRRRRLMCGRVRSRSGRPTASGSRCWSAWRGRARWPRAMTSAPPMT